MNHKYLRMNLKHGLCLTLLALIFTAGLTFSSIELPRLLDAFLYKNIDTLDVATGLNELSDYKTELYLRHYHLRLIGYGCLAIIGILVVVGFVTEKTGWTSAGAFILFLPVLGHFAATMFFLGGLGFLRLAWLPFLDMSFKFFRLGEIINLPYDILVKVCSLIGFNQRPILSYGITGLGLLIFFLGTLTWFYARMHGKKVADFWVYRISRHPQYLGWIIWSYGMMFLPGHNLKLCYELSNSLPWLLSTMIIIGVAMLEELKMRRLHKEAYESYLGHAPFLFPLPRFIARAFTLPLRLMFKKEYPGRKREIAAVLTFYTLLCLVLSTFYGGLAPLPEKKMPASNQKIAKLIRVLKENDNRAEKRHAASALGEIGESAIESLVALLKDRDVIVRAYSAAALGNIKSERVVSALIPLLHDQDAYVRRTVAESLGRTGSAKAIQPLVEALEDRTRGIASIATRALGDIKHPDVIPPLINALRDTDRNTTAAAAKALGEMGVREAIPNLVRCFEEMPDCPYDIVGEALWKLESDRAADAWLAGLKKGSWFYPRVSCAAALGRNKLEKGIPSLLEALKDESKEVRRAAVLALLEFESGKTLGALREALMDKDFEVRMYAEEAVKKIESR